VTTITNTPLQQIKIKSTCFNKSYVHHIIEVTIDPLFTKKLLEASMVTNYKGDPHNNYSITTNKNKIHML
jgi:hypothetical protein